ADADRIADGAKNDWDCAGGLLRGKSRRRPGRHDDIDLLAHEVFRKILQAFEISFRGLALDDDIPSLHVAEFHELAREGHGKRRAQAGVDQPNFEALLRARRERPRGRRSADERDELAAPHSITSWAAAMSFSGTLRPSACAVLRLTTNSNLVGCWTGRSPGLSPLRMRST